MSITVKSTLLQYLEHAIKLESEIVAQDQIISDFNNASLKNQPVLHYQPFPTKPREKKPEKILISNLVFYSFVILIVIEVLFGILLGRIVHINNETVFRILYILGIGISIGIPLYIFVFRVLHRNKQEKAIFQTKQDEYNEQCDQVYQENLQLENNYQQDLASWRSSDQNGRDQLTKLKNQTETVLSQFYSKGVIYQKYRNLPALTSIYEYLSSGRCDELTGANGAYNIYEAEVRQNTVINQLNIVISNLEQIRNNQYELYKQVYAINLNTQRIAAELNTIKGCTFTIAGLAALNAYYSSVAAENTAAIAFLQALR